MASLRERAMAFLRDEREPKEGGTGRKIVDLAAEAQKAQPRPNTPGTGSTLGIDKVGEGVAKKRGFMGRLRGMVGGKGKGTEIA